jgi:hypothetical protein
MLVASPRNQILKRKASPRELAFFFSADKGAFFNDYNISAPAAVSVFPEGSTKLRGVGPSAHTTISSTSTPSPKAGTLPPGNSRNGFQKKFGRPSDRCEDSEQEAVCRLLDKPVDHASW